MNTHPRHYVLLLAALSFFNFTLVESAVGRWSLCYGTPAADVFRAPNGEIPAYTERYDRFGTCPSPTKCYATFSYRGDYRYAGQPGHGVIALLRFVNRYPYLNFMQCFFILVKIGSSF